MTYLLDTNTCITFLRDRNSAVARKLAVTDPEEVCLCSIVKAELYYGAHRSAQPDHSLAILRQFIGGFHSLPFDDHAAEVYGQVRGELARSGNLIGPNDLLIASIAIAHQVVLVTHNTDEFRRVGGLGIEDWHG